MIGRLAPRRSQDEEAIQVDAYLEWLFDSHAGRPRPLNTDEPLPAHEQAAADLLAATLLRFHPSFRFEEALAGRLRAAAEAMRSGTPGFATEPDRAPLALPFPGALPAPLRRDDPRARGLLMGGAIASGVSLAGAAFLTWRRVRREAVAHGEPGSHHELAAHGELA